MEALKRYRTGAEQKVTLQHVSVADGGQAIIGNVTHGPRKSGQAAQKAATLPPALPDTNVVPMPIIGKGKEDDPLTFEGPSDEAKARRAMAESRAERDAMGEHPRERDEVFEWSGTPLPEPGAHQSAHSQARVAANYMGNLRRDSDAEALKTRDGFVNALKQHPDTVWSAAVAGKSEDEVADELAEGPPPSIVNSIKDGAVLKPLLDRVKPAELGDEDLFKGVRDSAHSMREFRDAIERAEQAIIADVDQQIDQQQAAAIEQQQEAVKPNGRERR